MYVGDEFVVCVCGKEIMCVLCVWERLSVCESVLYVCVRVWKRDCVCVCVKVPLSSLLIDQHK